MSAPVTSKRKNQRPYHYALCYAPSPASRSTVRRQYLRWRLERGLPVRCDIETCTFHTQPLSWLGKPLPLILDHINGNRLDNSPKNLRYLCPNCDSQLSTRGGKNRGRVLEATQGSYVLAGPRGSRNRFIITTPAVAVANGCMATITVANGEGLL